MENTSNSNSARGNLRKLPRISDDDSEYGILKSLQTCILDKNIDVLNHHIGYLKNEDLLEQLERIKVSHSLIFGLK
jgi:hypothetical protein